MKCAVVYRLIDEQVTVADLDVEAAIRVGTDPRLEVDRRALAAKVGKRHKVSISTFTTFRKLIHPTPPDLAGYYQPPFTAAIRGRARDSPESRACFMSVSRGWFRLVGAGETSFGRLAGRDDPGRLF